MRFKAIIHAIERVSSCVSGGWQVGGKKRLCNLRKWRKRRIGGGGGGGLVLLRGEKKAPTHATP